MAGGLVVNKGVFVKGHRKMGGRKKGITPTIQDIKGAILGAFDRLGGETYLVNVGRKTPSIYLALLAKVLPSDFNVNRTTITAVAALTTEELNELRSKLLVKIAEHANPVH